MSEGQFLVPLVEALDSLLFAQLSRRDTTSPVTRETGQVFFDVGAAEAGNKITNLRRSQRNREKHLKLDRFPRFSVLLEPFHGGMSGAQTIPAHVTSEHCVVQEILHQLER